MKRNIELNSTDWCDMIFEGKNKAYGAYQLRKSSSKRHVWAFVAALMAVTLLIAIPSLLKAVQPAKNLTVNINDTYEWVELHNEEENTIDEIIPPVAAPPTPQIIASAMFTPPAITADELVDPDKEMATQEELNKDKRVISVAYVDNDNTEGVLIEELLRDQRNIIDAPRTDPDKPVDFVEVMPQFPGGDAELLRYLSSNLRYPTIAAENGIQGRTVLRFVVGKDGSVSNITVVTQLDPSCDREAIRVVQSMPKWIPGKQNGNAVSVYYTLPILFRLQ